MLKGRNVVDTKLSKEEKIAILERNIKLLENDPTEGRSAFYTEMKIQLAELKGEEVKLGPGSIGYK